MVFLFAFCGPELSWVKVPRRIIRDSASSTTSSTAWDGISGRNPLPFVLVEDVADAIARAALKPELSGRSLNLVGDVAMTAREYIDELALAIGRPLRFHGQLPEKLYLVEWGKWGVKRLAGRKEALPNYRDLRSRGCLATFDCSDAKAALDWAPVSEREVFIDKAIRVHAAEAHKSYSPK